MTLASRVSVSSSAGIIPHRSKIPRARCSASDASLGRESASRQRPWPSRANASSIDDPEPLPARGRIGVGRGRSPMVATRLSERRARRD